MSAFPSTNQVFKGVIYIIFFLSPVLTDCTESEINNPCADPIGSDDMVLEDENVFCFMESVNGCFQIIWHDSSIEIISLNLTDKIRGRIVDIGEVNCLGDVITKPESGYMDSVMVQEHHGYVVKFPDETFGRIYIDSFVESLASDDIVSIRTTWQYTF
ncbi:hypothetical protein ACFLU5_08705 [Bacteroidota bacterium]